MGQSSANDNAQNQKYPILENRITSTYFEESKGTGKHSLYDSYIKAFRWSSDRLDPKGGGIISFISNGSWLDSKTASGFRICLEKEFSSIYVFNLRGNQRTSGELSRKEGGKIFGSGSRTPITITLLVKNPLAKNKKATIHYHDIGDYLNQESKLSIIRKFASVGNADMNWELLSPNEHGDWIKMRSDKFATYIPLGDKKDEIRTSFFENKYSFGLISSRDSWVWNFGKSNLENNIELTIDFYNEERLRFHEALNENPLLKLESFIKYDSKKITWDTRKLKGGIKKGHNINYCPTDIRTGIYRPFCKQQIYFNKELNHSLFS
ncbi:MAG: type ISP restriction/modification enzyme, partial [Flavobacteriales bacterium]